jgi:hypothetical protein
MALAMGTVVGNDSSRCQLRVQHRGTLFGAENTMNIERAKGVGHGRSYSGISNTKTFFY